MPVEVSAAQLQLLDNATGKVAEGDPGTWVPVTHTGDAYGIPGSWFWSGPALVILAICGVKQRMEKLFLFLLSTTPTFK